MNHKMKFVKTLIALIIGLTACAGLPDEIQGLGIDNVQSQEQATGAVQQQPSQARTTDGQALQGQAQRTDGQIPQGQSQNGSYSYIIVDTGQDHCYDDQSSIPCPTEGDAFFGQDAQYSGVQARYVDNGDGTITDLNTGLMWQQTPDLDNKMTFEEAVAGAESLELAGYSDWRLPTIKELYSLIDFNGGMSRGIPYIDTDDFDFRYGDESQGERDIDAQYWSSTEYVSTTMNGSHTVFGVNFADGRIKGYGTSNPRGGQMQQFVRYVRGNPDYGTNDFFDNGDGTISDMATGLMWQQIDSSITLDWEGALNYCSSLNYAGYNDWRLPNAKELQSIVDYSRSPKTTNSAAIAPIFSVSEIESWFWSSTTHLDFGVRSAVYVAFGQAYGVPNGNLIDVHGAGAQRSDPKSGDPGNYSDGRGSPGQDDQVRIYNYARCVREGIYGEVFTGGEVDQSVTSQPGGDQGGPDQSRDQAGPGAGGQTGGPPQEAIHACSGLSAGSACSVGPGSGTCEDVQSQLVCVPEGGPQSGPGGPRDSSQQQPGGMPGQQNGQSGPLPNGQQQPDSGPGQRNGGNGQPPQEAIAACNGQTQGASCQFTTPHGAVTGTCNLIQQQPACVPASGPPAGLSPPPHRPP